MTVEIKQKTRRRRNLSRVRHTREEREIWAGIDSVMRSIAKIQRRIKKDGEPVSQLELHELKRLGREYTSLIKRLPNDSSN